jgi:hypothetical protein
MVYLQPLQSVRIGRRSSVRGMSVCGMWYRILVVT